MNFHGVVMKASPDIGLHGDIIVMACESRGGWVERMHVARMIAGRHKAQAILTATMFNVVRFISDLDLYSSSAASY